MAKFLVEVTQTVEVELDETKFDEAFLAEFRESFYSFDDTREHAEYIGHLVARGLHDIEYSPEFIEGYGPSNEMGIKARIVDYDIQSGVRHD